MGMTMSMEIKAGTRVCPIHSRLRMIKEATGVASTTRMAGESSQSAARNVLVRKAGEHAGGNPQHIADENAQQRNAGGLQKPAGRARGPGAV